MTSQPLSTILEEMSSAQRTPRRRHLGTLDCSSAEFVDVVVSNLFCLHYTDPKDNDLSSLKATECDVMKVGSDSILRAVVLHASKDTFRFFTNVLSGINHTIFDRAPPGGDVVALRGFTLLNQQFERMGMMDGFPDVVFVRSRVNLYGWCADGCVVVNLRLCTTTCAVVITAYHEAVHCALRRRAHDFNFSTPDVRLGDSSGRLADVVRVWEEAKRISSCDAFPCEAGYCFECVCLGGVADFSSVLNHEMDQDVLRALRCEDEVPAWLLLPRERLCELSEFRCRSDRMLDLPGR